MKLPNAGLQAFGTPPRTIGCSFVASSRKPGTTVDFMNSMSGSSAFALISWKAGRPELVFMNFTVVRSAGSISTTNAWAPALGSALRFWTSWSNAFADSSACRRRKDVRGVLDLHLQRRELAFVRLMMPASFSLTCRRRFPQPPPLCQQRSVSAEAARRRRGTPLPAPSLAALVALRPSLSKNGNARESPSAAISPSSSCSSWLASTTASRPSSEPARLAASARICSDSAAILDRSMAGRSCLLDIGDAVDRPYECRLPPAIAADPKTAPPAASLPIPLEEACPSYRLKLFVFAWASLRPDT